MKHIYSYFNCFFIFLSILLLSACSTPKTTIPIDLNIIAAENLNPDYENRASPIVLRIYQLTHIDTFDKNDFFTLYENDKAILAKDLLYREEVEITPGQKILNKGFEIERNSNFIAVLAAYRDLDKSQWKSIFKIDHDKSLPPLTIDLKKFEVSIKPSKSSK